jgi:YD repeat-containing protein
VNNSRILEIQAMRLIPYKKFLFVALFALFLSCGQIWAQGSLPSGWSDGDVGSLVGTGSATYSNGVFTVKGGGNGVATTIDSFNFLYQSLSGDGTITARVVSNSFSGAQAGIMIRSTLDANSKNVFLWFRTPAPDYLFVFDRAATPGGTSNPSYLAYSSLPRWIRLARSGSTFTEYTSPDGLNWTQVGSSQAITMGQGAYIGLAVSSESDPTLATATFDNVSISSTSAPAPFISSISATTGTVGTQVVISGSNFGSSQGSSVVYLNGAAVTVNSWSGSSISTTIPSGATSGDLVVAVAPSMNASNPVEFTITSNPLPSGWLDQDIGTVSATGSATFSNGQFTVKGAGNTVGSSPSTADQFHFVYQPLSGDGTIVARIIGEQGSTGQAGVMIRETLDTSSANAFTAYVPNNGYPFLLDRPSAGSSESNTSNSALAPLPCWVKLVRSGTTFSGYLSSDGVNWVQIGWPQTINMASQVYIGLGVDGGDPATLVTATFDNVSVSSTATPSPAISTVSATTGTIGTQIVISGSGFGASQGSSLVLLNNAPLTINAWNTTSITATIPTGASSGYLVVSVAPSMNDSNPVTFSITSQPLPGGWLNQDIGTVGLVGNASYSSGVFTVQGAGNSVGATADGLHFVYQPLATDGAIVARVVSVQGTYGAQAGVMIRETQDPSSAEVSSLMFAYGGTYNSYMDYRTLYGGATSQAGGQTVTLPYWVEVVRSANTFSAYISPDGQPNNWTRVGNSQTFTTAQGVYVGLGVSSGVTTVLATATFDNVSVTAGSSLPDPVVTGISPSTGAPGASVTINGSGFGATQGTGVGASSVSFNGGATAAIASWSDTQIVAILPQGATTGPVSVIVGNITGTGPTFTVKFIAQLIDSLGNVSTYTSQPSGGLWVMSDLQGSGCSSCSSRGNVHNQYDSNGHAVWTTDALGTTTSNRYNSSSNLVEQITQFGSSTPTTSYSYNSFGEVVSVRDALGHTTQNAYDTHGNLTSVTTPLGNVTQFAYNSLGELTQITDPLNNVTTLTYTSAGLIHTITDAQSNVTTYGYDAHGNRTSVTDALSHQTTFAYDAGDRLTTITYPDTTTTTFTYDSRGRRTSVTDQNGKTTTYAYDDADRLTSVTDASATSRHTPTTPRTTCSPSPTPTATKPRSPTTPLAVSRKPISRPRRSKPTPTTPTTT